MILQMTRAVQGGLRQEKQFELISNHLANASTTGFKADILSFDSVFKANLTVDTTQGSLKQTGNNLDCAIDGKGFFRIQTARGVRYTRSGNFSLNNNQVLVTNNGDPVLGGGGPITITGNNISIGKNGEVSSDGNTVGRIALTDFASPEQLQKDGDSLFVYNGPPGDQTFPAETSIQQGTLEQPNISTAREMVKMINAHRMYEAYQKMIHTLDEVDSKAILEIGKL
jgi:flagellar basal-body rod protein FlgF